MAQRIQVDGVDFASVFRFTRVLRCVTAALQPPRLVVGLLVIVALVAFGKTWDRATDPTVPPGGYLADLGSTADASRAAALVAAVHAALDTYPRTDPLPIAATDAITELDRRYANRRAALVAPTDGARAPVDAVRRADAVYRAHRASLVALAPRGAFAALSGELRAGLEHAVRGVLTLEPADVFRAGHDLFVRLPVAIWGTQRAFALSFGAWALFVVALGGAALSRMAACELAGEERLRVRDAVDFALGNIARVVLAPILPLAVAALLAAVVAGVSAVGRIPGLDVISGVLYGLGLLVGFVAALLLLSYAIAFFMLLPAVAVENCDAVDAHQRAFAYALNRPLHLIGYGFVALAGLALGYVVVAFIAMTTLEVTGAATSALGPASLAFDGAEIGLFDLTAGTPVPATSWHEAWTIALVEFWRTIVIDLVAAWIVSYYFFSATAVYLLLRRACDGQDLEEIWRPGLVPGTLVPLPTPALGERVIVRTLRGVSRWRR